MSRPLDPKWNPAHPETQFFFNDRDRKTGKVFTVLFDLAADGGKGKRVREYRFADTPVANGGGVVRGSPASAPKERDVNHLFEKQPP